MGKYLCDNTPGCSSFDMHQTLERCFLNTEACWHEDVHAGFDPNYRMFMARIDHADQQSPPTQTKRRLGENDGPKKVLRFTEVQAKSGGTFRACFCDSSLVF